MKVGSLVECVQITKHPSPHDLIVKYPVKGKVYTIRNIEDFGEGLIGVYLEEIINKNSYCGTEYCYAHSDFREVEIPPSIEAQIEEIMEDQMVLVEF